MKQAKLYCERVVTKDGEFAVKVNNWENVEKSADLPQSYLENYPYFYEMYDPFHYVIILKTAEDETRTISKGDLFSLSDFYTIKIEMERAGERLHKIIENISKLKHIWYGKFEITI